MIYLLDTNAWVEFLRQTNSPIVARVRAFAPTELRKCSIVTAELLYGCLRSAQPVANRSKVDSLLRPYTSLPFDELAAEQYSVIRTTLEKRGTPIGSLDTQIAAIAIANGCTLVTHNTREFSRVPNLVLEDWHLP